MLIFRQIVLALNLLLVLVFGLAALSLGRRKLKPKTEAKVGLFLIILFSTFLALLLLFAVAGAALSGNAAYLALLVYVAIPFIIGKFASYRTLRLYSALQFLDFLLSTATLYAI